MSPPPRPARAGQPVTLRAADGHRLAATLHRGKGRDALVVAGATGVQHRFYDAFARHVAAGPGGPDVLTFDYRGVGGSRPDTLKGFRATMRQWGELDLDAALRWTLREREPDRLLLVGHSVGGQLLGHASAGDEVAAAWLVGSQSGHWRHWPLAGRAGIFALWHLLIPGLSRTLGHFPSHWFGLGEPLPSGVAREWARWGRHRDYLLRRARGRRALREAAPADCRRQHRRRLLRAGGCRPGAAGHVPERPAAAGPRRQGRALRLVPARQRGAVGRGDGVAPGAGAGRRRLACR